MFYIGNKPILAPEIEVLEELKSQLALQGIARFNKFVETTNHIQFNCPIHKDGQERKPYCGITTNKIITELSNGKKKVIEPGTVHCFRCGYTASLPEMISDCFGRTDNGLFGMQWLTKNFLTLSIEERKPLSIDLSRNTITNTLPHYISEEELDTYRYIHPYMYQRKLTDKIIEMFDVGYDNDFILTDKSKREHHLQCLTFPVRDIDGNTLFIARRCVNNKIFHYPENAVKPVYGIYELSSLPNYPKEVIICESIINALTCWSYGKPAVALNGTGTPNQMNELANLPVRHYITGLDPDEAGYKGTAKIKKALGNKKLITTLIVPTGKDINDLTKEEFNNLEETSLL